MAKSENQKLKTLFVAKYFMENSDDNHAVTAGDIIDYLQDEYGIAADRRSIYRDIAALRDQFGLDICGSQGGRYRLLSRQFEYDDLLLLAECVYAAKFISAPKAKELVNTICEFCSTYQAEGLSHEVFLCDRVKTTQKGILNIISTIRSAMATRQDGKPRRPTKICFKYTHHVISNINQRVERRQGSLYVVSPYKLLINDGNYYLLAFDDRSQEMRTYRVDRMKDVRLFQELREGSAAYAALDIQTYTKRVFSMFGGERQRVSIRFENNFLDTVIERFGTGNDTLYRPEGEEHFVVNTEVEISEQFFGWLIGFGTSAKLLGPQAIVYQFNSFLLSIQSLY